MIIKREDYENQIAYLQAVCRIAADHLQNGGTFPINGETWALLDYAAGPRKKAAPQGVAAGEPAQKQSHPEDAAVSTDDAAGSVDKEGK